MSATARGGVGHKYNARRTEYRGEWYASAAEARRAMELDALVDLGEVASWSRAGSIELVPKPHRISYTPDFVVVARGGLTYWYEDVKGVETPVFKLKRKLLAWRYPNLELRVLRVR